MIAVDDEQAALRALKRAIKTIEPNASITCFLSAWEALAYARENPVKVAFLDIEMNEINGLLLAKELQAIYGQTNIIFVTGYREYALDAFGVNASGYVMKPINAAYVARELENLRYRVKVPDNRVKVQCFGNFEVFVNGQPVTFSRSKSKEALAYLVDRKGAGVSKKELAAILLENEEYTRSVQSYIHTIIAEMTRALKSVGVDNIIINNGGRYSVDTTKLDCDFYNCEKGDAAAVNSYCGEYMSNYSWTELTAGFLTRKYCKPT